MHNLCSIGVCTVHMPYRSALHAHRLWEVPNTCDTAGLQGCPMSIGVTPRYAVKALGQYCGRFAPPVHSTYAPCMMWAHPFNVYPIPILFLFLILCVLCICNSYVQSLFANGMCTMYTQHIHALDVCILYMHLCGVVPSIKFRRQYIYGNNLIISRTWWQKL